MEMSQIRYFIAVSETLNFTRAAERCCISQPALTKGIQKLENSIGGELVYRTKNSVALSFLGRSLLPKFIKIINDAKSTKNEARRLIHHQCSMIRVGIENNIFLGELMPLFKRFKLNNASVEFAFFEHEHKQLRDKLNSHELDVAFLSELKNKREHPGEREISSEEFVIAFGERHPFACEDSISLEMLHLQNYCFREHCEASALLQRDLAAREIDLNVVYSSSRDDWIKSFVQESYGITYLSKREAISDGLLFVAVNDYKLYRCVSLRMVDCINRKSTIKPFFDAMKLNHWATEIAC